MGSCVQLTNKYETGRCFTFDLLQPSLKDLFNTVVYASNIKRALDTEDNQLTMFAPVEIQSQEVQNLIEKVSKIDATDEDKKALAKFLRGHIVAGAAVQISGASINGATNARGSFDLGEKDKFRIANGDPQCECTGCGEDGEEEGECICECKAAVRGKLTLKEERGDIVVVNDEGAKATVLIENILARNGVIHLIDKALI